MISHSHDLESLKHKCQGKRKRLCKCQTLQDGLYSWTFFRNLCNL